MNCPSCGWSLKEDLESHRVSKTKIKYKVYCAECEIKIKVTMDKKKYDLKCEKYKLTPKYLMD
jgi:transcription elongation factor Elf1